MEQVSGHDLKWFFTQWLTRAGNPTIAGTWTYDAPRKELSLTLRQTQAGEPYRLRVDVEVATARGKSIQTVRLDASSATVQWPVDGEPVSITLDPRTTLLAELGTPQRVNTKGTK